MSWSGRRVRRRLGIPRDERLLAWATADPQGMRVPGRMAGPVRRWPAHVALTDEALWVGRAGASRRFDLEDVILASEAERPEGALRVDFRSGDPLVVTVLDGGSFHYHLVREIRLVERRLRREATRTAGFFGPSLGLLLAAERGGAPPTPGPQPGGPDGGAGDVPSSDGSFDLLREAEVIARRELRRVLTGTQTGPWGGTSR